MEKAGCRVWPRFVNAGICKTAGGYASGHGVRILFFPSVFIFLRRLSLGSVPSVDNPLAPINVFGRVSGWPFPLDSANGNPLASLSGTIGSWIATGSSNVLL
jgi:hypothetical protein